MIARNSLSFAEVSGKLFDILLLSTLAAINTLPYALAKKLSLRIKETDPKGVNAAF